MPHGKGLIRATNRRGVHSGRMRGTPGAHLSGTPVCQRCGATRVHRQWQRAPLTHSTLAEAAWTICPTCRQVEREEWVGRVLLRGTFPRANAGAVERRIRGVARYAAGTRSDRRIVSLERSKTGDMEVLTTSQALAHRIVHELKKLFGGRSRYAWSEDGSLVAHWTCDRAGKVVS